MPARCHSAVWGRGTGQFSNPVRWPRVSTLSKMDNPSWRGSRGGHRGAGRRWRTQTHVLLGRSSEGHDGEDSRVDPPDGPGLGDVPPTFERVTS